MPKMSRGGKVLQSALPDTVRRSSKQAQETFAKAHDNAVETYGEGERAHRTAYSALKRRFEMKGDRWVRKSHAAPPASRATSARAGVSRGRTFGGANANGHTKKELYERAAVLHVRGRSKMSKRQLAAAVARAQR